MFASAVAIRLSERSRPRAAQGATTLDDQVDLDVTVYNSDIALVRDVRNVRAAARARST